MLIWACSRTEDCGYAAGVSSSSMRQVFRLALGLCSLLLPASASAAVQHGTLERPLDPRGLLPGTVTVRYELYSPETPPNVHAPTILAVEGGPGGASTGSAGYFIDAFGPLLETHPLLIVDLRGTGRSGALGCAAYQHGGYVDADAIARCGAKLGPRAWRYSTAFAVDDVAAVLDALGLDSVHVYGDSYGTFFSQAFALYHPERVRSVVLDAAYGVEGLDPWYPEIGEGIRFALRRACGRDAGCAAIGGDPVDRLAALVAELRLAPLVGLATDSRGRRQTITLDAPSLAALVSNATYEWQIYRELDPAVRAALDGDPLPILRLAGEQRAGFYGRRYYSQALENAASCADYPQLYAMTAEPALRRVQYRAAIDRLAASTPEMFSPFDLETWLASPFNAYGVCLDWPAAAAPIPPFPTPRTYPDVPVLVLNGDLDTITPVAGAELVAARFPGAIFVTVANAVHVTALGTIRDCSPLLVREFIATGAIADASCAAAAPPVRVLDAFWPALDAVPAAVGPPLDVAQRRLVTAALATLADVLNRRPALFASRGRGLRGGRYRFMAGPTTGVQMRGVELIAGVAVDGRLRWDEGTDVVSGTLTTHGMTFSLVWSPVLDRPTATVQLGTWSGEVAVP